MLVCFLLAMLLRQLTVVFTKSIILKNGKTQEKKKRISWLFWIGKY